MGYTGTRKAYQLLLCGKAGKKRTSCKGKYSATAMPPESNTCTVKNSSRTIRAWAPERRRQVQHTMRGQWPLCMCTTAGTRYRPAQSPSCRSALGCARA
eukprot:3457203-Pleurochrysis_carterae.AAC.1